MTNPYWPALVPSHEAMRTVDAQCRHQECLASDAEDLQALGDLEKDLKRKGSVK